MSKLSPKNIPDKIWEDLHTETLEWKSNLSFMKDEIIFFDHLLNSYVFQPNTPNLFERIQDYLKRLKKVEKNRGRIANLIMKHANDLGGALECSNEVSSLDYRQRHANLKIEVSDCAYTFQELKAQVFNYASGILKKRKPTKYGQGINKN